MQLIESNINILKNQGYMITNDMANISYMQIHEKLLTTY